MDIWVSHKMLCFVEEPCSCPVEVKTGWDGSSSTVAGWNLTGVGVLGDQSYGTSSTGCRRGAGMTGFLRQGEETRKGLSS